MPVTTPNIEPVLEKLHRASSHCTIYNDAPLLPAFGGDM